MGGQSRSLAKSKTKTEKNEIMLAKGGKKSVVSPTPSEASFVYGLSSGHSDAGFTRSSGLSTAEKKAVSQLRSIRKLRDQFAASSVNNDASSTHDSYAHSSLPSASGSR